MANKSLCPCFFFTIITVMHTTTASHHILHEIPTCTVCTKSVEPEDTTPPSFANCKHASQFHADCINRWVSKCLENGRTPTCPNCRGELSSPPWKSLLTQAILIISFVFIISGVSAYYASEIKKYFHVDFSCAMLTYIIWMVVLFSMILYQDLRLTFSAQSDASFPTYFLKISKGVMLLQFLCILSGMVSIIPTAGT